jgi:protein O-mannosyl-transferase
VPASTNHPNTPFAGAEKRAVILCLLLAVATLAIYNPVARHPFVNYDDDRYVYENPHVKAGLTWSTVHWAFTTTAEANWHPLTWLSHAADCQLFHVNPAGHHYMNLLLHTVNAVLLFLLLWRATGRAGPSWMVAALFAVHPINVESVAWIAERKNVLSMLFFLLALDAYRRYAQRPGVVRYSIVALLFACGLMAKPQVITFPFVLLLWDYWPLERMLPPPSSEPDTIPMTGAQSVFRLVFEKLPLMLLCVASSIITMKAQQAGGAVGTFTQYPFSMRLQNAIVSYARYLGKAFWPWPLAPMYPHPENSLATWQIAGALLLLAAITAAVFVLAMRGRRYLATGWFWFLGSLVPMIGVVQVGSQAMADRYAYLPFVGLFIMACWGVAEFMRRRRISWLAPAIAGGAVLAALSAVTRRQLAYWNDNVILWSHTLQVTTDNFLAEDNLGGALISAGHLEQAMPHFRRAVAISPLDGVSNLNLAVYAQAHGDFQEAIERYNLVIHETRERKTESTAYSNLGFAYRSVGDYGEAKASYLAAMQANPDNVKPIYGLALLAQKTGDLAQAAEYYARAVALQPSDYGYLLLAQALGKSGRTADAQAAYQKAQQLSSNFDQAQQAAHSLLMQ